MNKFEKYSMSFILLICGVLYSCSDGTTCETRFIPLNDSIQLYIARYYHDKQAAISLTFDDGTNDQYVHAVSALDARNMKGTFFITGSILSEKHLSDSNRLTYKQVKEMAEKGYEIGNHTFHHTDLTSIPLDSARKEIDLNDSLIYLLTGVAPITLAFPYNARNAEVEKIALQHKTAVRMHEKALGQSDSHTTREDAIRWVDDIIKNKSWGVAMLHGIETGYDHWINPEDFYKLLDYINARPEIWVGMFKEVAAYTNEEKNATVEAVYSENKIRGIIRTRLDTALFNHPLTIVIQVSGKQVRMVDVMPDKMFEVDI